MKLERKVAIIDKYEPNLQRDEIERNSYELQGISIVGMLVNITTTPEEVAFFVAGENPHLVILAENYANTDDVIRDLQERFKGMHSMQAGEFQPIKRGEGIDALVRIRELNPELPVYMLSSNPLHMERAMSAGAKGYINITPFPAELRRILDGHYPNVTLPH